jgi:NADH-quinone oxidoreductase subunit J
MILSISILFGILIVIAVISLWFTSNVLYASFWLLLVFLALAGVYVTLGADFLAITQIIIYVGGVLILLIFGVMLTHQTKHSEPPTTQMHYQRGSLMLCILTSFILIKTIAEVKWENLNWIKKSIQNREQIESSTIHHLGVKLMTNYLLPFEIIALLLLLALIGATLLASKKNN